jgi:hypothetical protein
VDPEAPSAPIAQLTGRVRAKGSRRGADYVETAISQYYGFVFWPDTVGLVGFTDEG